MKLYVFRHGETDANKKRILQGNMDIPLNSKGLEQANKLKEKLAVLNLPVIYSSSLKRAKATAEIVSCSNNSKIIILDELKEIDFGDYEGANAEEFFKSHKTLFGQITDINNPEFLTEKNHNAESRQDVLSRWLKALSFIKEHCAYDCAGVSTHGGMMGVIYYWYFHEYRFMFDNCECLEIEV